MKIFKEQRYLTEHSSEMARLVINSRLGKINLAINYENGNTTKSCRLCGETKDSFNPMILGFSFSVTFSVMIWQNRDSHVVTVGGNYLRPFKSYTRPFKDLLVTYKTSD